MGFTLIKGTFKVVGKSPDGDTIGFLADKKSDWRKLAGRYPKLNKSDHASIRFEAIDALETHYGGSHQPKSLADAATDSMLSAAGYSSVTWGPTHGKVTGASPQTVKGFILARKTEMYGRPVSFVFAGSHRRPTGSEVFLDVKLLRKSLNYKLIRAGLAYPTYYTGLFPDLRNAITAAAIDAFNRDRGVWPYDWTNVGVPVKNQAALEDDYCILPKLFRRLTAYNKSGSSKTFKKWLEAKDDPVMVLSTGHFTNLDTLIIQNGNRVSLSVYPEDLVFMS